MQPHEIEKLQQQYTDQYVMVDAARPELARFAGIPGQIKTINMNGRALVQFDWADLGWHDIALDWLKIIDKPAPPPVKETAAKKPVPAKQPTAEKPAEEGSK
jgi:hypothetical protein